MAWLRMALLIVRNVLRDHSVFAIENLALRQKLAILYQRSKRPPLRKRHRFLVGLAVTVTPDRPKIGMGSLYYKERYDLTITAILTAALSLVVFIVIRLDIRHYLRHRPRPRLKTESV